MIKWVSEIIKKRTERGCHIYAAPRRGCLGYSKVYCDVRKRWFVAWNQNRHITYYIFHIQYTNSEMSIVDIPYVNHFGAIMVYEFRVTIVLPCERPGFDSLWRSYQQFTLPPRAARPTQPSILLRLVNKYRLIPGLTPGHRRRGLLPSTTTGGMTNGYVPTIPGR